MAQKGRSYYYVTNDRPRRWIRLGDDYPKALAEWAKLEGEPVPETARTLTQVAAWYRKDVLPKKAARTQKDNETELLRLEAVFGSSPLETITPVDVATYLDHRSDEDGNPAPVRANREIALLSHVINFARRRGFTTMANPCAGVRRNKETGRTRYVEDAEFDAIYEKADEILQDAMDLLYFTGQRPGDVLKMKRTEIRDGYLWVRQGKTRRPLRIADEADLATALARMLNRPRKATGAPLVQDANGQPLTYWQLEDRWSKAREAAGFAEANLQMRDIRGKTATDLEDLAKAQALLGHASRTMTERYVKQRAGERVSPLKRKPKL